MSSMQWCPAHWSEIRELVTQGSHNGIVITLELVKRWIAKAGAEGRLSADMSEGEKNSVMRQDAPLCCYMGRTVLDEAIIVGHCAPLPLCLKCLIPRDVCHCTITKPFIGSY